MSDMQILTASRLRTVRDCARKEYLSYVERWRPAQEPEYFRVGTLVHLGLEAWTIVRAAHDEGALEAALAAVAGKAFDAFEQVRVDELLRGYDLRWRDEPFELVAVEQEFRTKLLNPETFAASRTWEAAGKIDGILLVGGRKLILEHKTAGEEISDPTGSYWLKLQMDHQVSIYFLGAESLGHQVEGCLYDVLRKPALRPYLATPPEQRKYTQEKRDKKTGELLEPARLYANQHAEDETPFDYGVRVRAEIEGNPDRYYARREIPRMNSQVEEFMYDAWAQANAMREIHRAAERKGPLAVPRNPEACFRFGSCPYWEICALGLRPEEHPDVFVRSESAHPELSPETVQGGQKE